MIYIIIGKDNDSFNEWVEHATFDNSLDAAARCQELKEINDGIATYRVETVEPSPGKTISRLYADKLVAADRRAFKLQANAFWARAKMDHEEGYPDTDSMTTKEFTMPELFGDAVIAERCCSECGAFVPFEKARQTHVAWHNKLLP